MSCPTDPWISSSSVSESNSAEVTGVRVTLPVTVRLEAPKDRRQWPTVQPFSSVISTLTVSGYGQPTKSNLYDTEI